MMIFGPFAAPTTSAVTDALASVSASEVTLSPSTSSSTGSETDSPTPVPTLSISMTSPTATFCWVAPLRTIAYTATHSPRRSITSPGQRARLTVSQEAGAQNHCTDERARSAHQGSSVRKGRRTGQNGRRPFGTRRSALPGALLLHRHVRLAGPVDRPVDCPVDCAVDRSVAPVRGRVGRLSRLRTCGRDRDGDLGGGPVRLDVDQRLVRRFDD